MTIVVKKRQKLQKNTITCVREKIVIIIIYSDKYIIYLCKRNTYKPMEKRIISVNISGYLREWIYHKFGHPAVFPHHSFENSLLAEHLAHRPPLVHPQVVDDEMHTCIAVPCFRNKRWPSYNYFTHEGEVLLKKQMRCLFRNDLREILLQIHLPGNADRINDWCRVRGISLAYRGSVEKMFYRVRKEYDEQHIILGQRYNKVKE